MKNHPDAQSANPGSIIFLVGMPAVGKTYWGLQLAEAYRLQFIDLDALITAHEQASIQALFAKYGENGFREREQQQLKSIKNTGSLPLIVACGGGAPCFADNMAYMKKTGTVIYLQASVAYLLQNLEISTEVRPMLSNRGDLAAYLSTLLQKRSRFYEQAHHILQAKDITLATFDKIIAHV